VQLSFGGSKSSPTTSVVKKPLNGLPAYNQSLTSAYNKMKSITSAKPVVAPVVKKPVTKAPVKPVSVGGVKVTTTAKKPATVVTGGGGVSTGTSLAPTASVVPSATASGLLRKVRTRTTHPYRQVTRKHVMMRLRRLRRTITRMLLLVRSIYRTLKTRMPKQ
jgi:uncharacterized spore protein YtfJ